MDVRVRTASRVGGQSVMCIDSSVGRHSSTRVDEANRMLNSSRDKNEVAYRSGEGGGGPAMQPRI